MASTRYMLSQQFLVIRKFCIRNILCGSNVCKENEIFKRCNSSSVWDNLESVDVEAKLAGERSIQLSSGKYARFADGSAVAEIGGTVVLATAVSKNTGQSSSFMPLTVEYREKSAAAGRIPTNFLRRELGPTEHEIVTSRLIDRSIRNAFPPGYSSQTQINCNLLSVDGINSPDIASINATSAALSLSDIPWMGPVAAVRIGLINDEIIVNPTRKEMNMSSLNLVVTGSSSNTVVMLECSGNNVFFQDFQRALKKGVKETQVIIKTISQLQQEVGKVKRDLTEIKECSDEIKQFVKTNYSNQIKDVFQDHSHNKVSRDIAIRNLRNSIKVKYTETFPEGIINELVFNEFDNLFKKIFRDLILNEKIRCDGRKLHTIRDIHCDVDLFKPLHGSALFQRGQTQVLCTVTFDSLDSAFKSNPVSVLAGGLKEKNFMLHYEFPQYAVNEIGLSKAVGRREIGHGALAEKAIRPMIPQDYPFTIRLTSEVLESNGSSSMATVCGGCMALMDAGVSLSGPVAGIAIGLVSENDFNSYRLLTDILGIEDYLGDMDFKIAGTKSGITAVQCDTKLSKLPLKVIYEAIAKGQVGISKILDKMNETISEPRRDKKQNSPVTETIDIPVHKRSKFVGFGGYNLRKLTDETGVRVTSLDEGTFSIFAPNQAAMTEAKDWINVTLEEVRDPVLQFGASYKAKIIEIIDAGILVTLFPNMKPALVPNSQLDQRKINHPSVLNLKVNDEIFVKYFGRDPASGSMRLSRKALQIVRVNSIPKTFFDSQSSQNVSNSLDGENKD